jgi:hypothetical protein
MKRILTAAALAALLFAACTKNEGIAPVETPPIVVIPPIDPPTTRCWECTIEEMIPFWVDQWCGTRELVTICDKDSLGIVQMCDSMFVDHPTYKRKVWCD